MQNYEKPVCLLFGANGQVGFELCRSLSLDFNVVALARRQCDFSDAGQIRQAIQTIKPSVIVNAAAYTAVDKAESESVLAQAINADAVAIMAQEAKKINAAIVHYSTDYVFNGQASQPYIETDVVDPQNVYGRSKLAGEQQLLDVLGTAYPFWILRTSWVYGLHGNNFLKTMLKLATKRDTLSVVSDQIGAPTSAALIADVTARLLQIRPAPGTFHLSAAGQTNWHEYTQLLISRAGSKGMALSLNQHQVMPISTAEYPTAAKRPAYSVLNCNKLEKALAIKLPDWRLGVEQVVDIIVESQKA
jgi:dTDP-4-dehydrorhamnose reductase